MYWLDNMFFLGGGGGGGLGVYEDQKGGVCMYVRESKGGVCMYEDQKRGYNTRINAPP